MNNQLLMVELRELAEVMRDYAEESRSVGSQRLESYYVGKAVAFEEVISMIESSPSLTIGCSKCDYKGYFEYETGVVDGGTQIKEIAKEPCDCVIDRIPTIKPGEQLLPEWLIEKLNNEHTILHYSGEKYRIVSEIVAVEKVKGR